MRACIDFFFNRMIKSPWQEKIRKPVFVNSTVGLSNISRTAGRDN